MSAENNTLQGQLSELTAALIQEREKLRSVERQLVDKMQEVECLSRMRKMRRESEFDEVSEPSTKRLRVSQEQNTIATSLFTEPLSPPTTLFSSTQPASQGQLLKPCFTQTYQSLLLFPENPTAEDLMRIIEGALKITEDDILE